METLTRPTPTDIARYTMRADVHRHSGPCGIFASHYLRAEEYASTSVMPTDERVIYVLTSVTMARRIYATYLFGSSELNRIRVRKAIQDRTDDPVVWRKLSA